MVATHIHLQASRSRSFLLAAAAHGGRTPPCGIIKAASASKQRISSVSVVLLALRPSVHLFYMPSTNCISPCMIRDDSDEKPNSDGSTLPPFLAPPFFFPAAWKPSSSCCFAPFLPPALFVQEGMGQERGQMCVVGSESCKQHGCASKAGG